MAEIEKRKKALSVSPLKSSQTVGASLAFLGFSNSMPIMHGSQGCTAFAKVFFVRHFREPVPLQTTAMDQVSSVMGADDNIVEALRVVAEKSAPKIIGLVTTGLAETQGADIRGAVKQFREENPDLSATEVVAVNTPDFTGCFESGYAMAVKAIIDTLVPDSSTEPKVGLRPKQVNVLCHGNLTPSDLEYIQESIESFGLRAMLIPDLSRSLDGHLSDEKYNPLTTGGLSVDDLKTAGESIATFVIGDSLIEAGESLKNRTGVESYHFSHLFTLDAVDRWIETLANISQKNIPEKWLRHRTQLLDAMLDTHFMIGTTPLGIAGDPDLVIAFHELAKSMGADPCVCVVPYKGKTLHELDVQLVKVGDLEDLEKLSKQRDVKLLVTNSHGVESAKRLGVPILRMGFPQYDYIGGFQRCWSGYRGIVNSLFDMANLLQNSHKEVEPYVSIFKQAEYGPSDRIQ